MQNKKLVNLDVRIIESGGYCSRISGNKTDNGVVNYLSEFLKGEF